MRKRDYVDLLGLGVEDLIAEVRKVREARPKNGVRTCGIINAKSGKCGEDCTFCAQSSHHGAEVDIYPLKTVEEMVKAAISAKSDGAERFGIVTSGNRLSGEEVERVAKAIRVIRDQAGIKPCASIGTLDLDSFMMLKEAGLERYHHNIETSENYYPNIVATHSYADRIETIRSAKQAGLQVCSGGIIGLGESWKDRLDMALSLKELEADAVPLNFLVPRKGTPLADADMLSPLDAIRTISLFRLVLPDREIRIAAGREQVLKDFQGLMFLAGADGMMVGGYLTLAGRPVKEDRILIDQIERLWKTG